MGVRKKVGTRDWLADYRDGGGHRRRETARSRGEAERLLAKRQVEISQGNYMAPRSGGRMKFKDLATQAMARKKLRLRPLSYKTDERRLKQVLPLLGHAPVEEIKAAHIDDVLAHLKRDGISDSTVNRFHALISSILKFAVDNEILPANPAKKVKRYKENESRLRWLTDDEEARVKDAFVSDANEDEFVLAVNTGMRRGEQWGLLWADVDFANEEITVRGKTGRRHIPLNSAAIKALRRLQKLSGEKPFVSPDHREGLDRDFRRWFEAACKKAKVKNFHWHDLRHTFASRLMQKGESIRVVQTLLGHKSVTMTEKYAHFAPDHRKTAVEKLVGEPSS